MRYREISAFIAIVAFPVVGCTLAPKNPRENRRYSQAASEVGRGIEVGKLILKASSLSDNIRFSQGRNVQMQGDVAASRRKAIAKYIDTVDRLKGMRIKYVEMGFSDFLAREGYFSGRVPDRLDRPVLELLRAHVEMKGDYPIEDLERDFRWEARKVHNL